MNAIDVVSMTALVADSEPEPLKQCTAAFFLRRSNKILDYHLDRDVIVYVRQSSTHQVLNHRESRERQYGLVRVAVDLGWSKDRVRVIDDDQGESGKAIANRTGFLRLLAEVTMGHVGLVLGIEMSRLARSNKEWLGLVEVCTVFGSLLADEDGVYDPRDPNDRLLLGLKGTISEYELVLMSNRLLKNRLSKAQRGELFQNVPIGYIKCSSERVVLDPDEQVRNVVHLIFDKFDELGSTGKVFHYLLRNRILLGIRPFHGSNRGQLEWRRPNLGTVRQILRHPIYAGVYTYGHLPSKRAVPIPNKHATTDSCDPKTGWKVVIRDRLPAYITWDRYLANQNRLRQNRCLSDTPGPPRQGNALLAGLVVCGQCGCRLLANYRSRERARYDCIRHRREGTQQRCWGLKAAVLDDLVRQQVFRALEPAALELSCRAIEDLQRDRDRLDRHWKQRMERARHEAWDAERRYRAVDPDNRLVARTLEQAWEEKLRSQRELRDDYDRFLHERPPVLSAAEKARIAALAADLPALWHAPETTPQDHKEIIRHLVERVVVHVKNDSEHVGVTIHWHGGFTSQHAITRPVGSYEQSSVFGRLLERAMGLHEEGRTAREIAECLNQEGFSTPRRRGQFSPDLVRQLLSRRGLTNAIRRTEPLGPHERWLSELAKEIPISAGKLSDWVRRGWLHSRKTRSQRRWVLWADKQEMRRLRQLAEMSQRGSVEYPPELTTPKLRGHRPTPIRPT
jgi:DNA invertase Pin-like site-specific DNA recombinase